MLLFIIVVCFLRFLHIAASGQRLMQFCYFGVLHYYEMCILHPFIITHHEAPSPPPQHHHAITTIRLPTKNHNNRRQRRGQIQPSPALQQQQIRRELPNDNRHKLHLQNPLNRRRQHQTAGVGHGRPRQIQNHHTELLQRQPRSADRVLRRQSEFVSVSEY